LKRETLELLYKMTNQDNIEFIIEKLMEQLKISSDSFFKKEMVNKVIFLNFSNFRF
jgi:AP-4 complex subunit epsilon-1